jgi:hypothetical protein
VAFGVDLGTTNSSIAWSDASGQVHSLSVRSGKEPFDAVLRSVVLDPLGRHGDPVVGHLAFGAATSQPQDAVLLTSFKVKLDKQRLRESVVQYKMEKTGDYDFVNECVRFASHAVVVPLNYDEHSREEVIGAAGQVLRRLLLSEEIARDPAIQTGAVPRGALGRFLGSLRRTADTETDGANHPAAFDPQDDERLFIGVPVTFGPTARKRLLAALARSGVFGGAPGCYRNILRRCRFVYEPLALASTLQMFEESETVLIIDYGGGTLDLALLDITFDEAGFAAKERALGGVPQAGDHLDALFRERLLAKDEQLRRAYDVELGSGSPFDRWRADNYFSLAKIELSSSETTVLRLPGFAREVRRGDFEQAIEPALGDVLAAVDDCLQRGGVSTHDVGHVVLTGGSSLIPALQNQLRARFEHLDHSRFAAGQPGDQASEREALTGVSRGLANYGFVSQFFEGVAPCDYAVWTTGSRHFVPCIQRGDPAVMRVDEGPATRVRVGDESCASFALYANLVREAFSGALADLSIPTGVEEVEVRVAASRGRFVPAFGIFDPRTGQRLASDFDLDALPPDKLAAFIESDREWLQGGEHLRSAFLTRPLENGDFVEWRRDGSHRRGKVIDIRDVDLNEHVARMAAFDPGPYRVAVAIEEQRGVVDFGRREYCDWKCGEVRLV